ncbi:MULTISPECIES: bifunctional glutamate N-acetyltransferase/amino-acid acetyltransferase ArgJ [Glaesserella]|uniref:Arginine biosynthesis bifunctional protein ArgJ n=1 Tax=Glaesserella australis TaxID=2094024 RepID=A0A328BZI8_9PAST|nr:MULTISPECIES: bifunctional glutamate N-acetyltransferase/amino-acid acetyltransferase ArgJ [Glaesserella]AUI65648.1 bifunctional ornithine acetyltransferase/N-acetylglutamate synthase [Glaesserella sp. 15-184]RAL19065.1 arginine biosynthesis protein ArgJ [Glaesserella australis]
MNTTAILGGVTAPQGFKASGIHCGIRKNKEKLDLALLVSDVPCATAAVYTQNKVKGAPILVTKANIADGYSQAMMCNSGNANTCNPNGIELAEKCCEMVATALNLKASDIVIASTGVIGQPLPLEPFEQGIPKAVASLSYQGGTQAAEAIMTTDTRLKEYAVAFELGGKTCHMGIMTKGSGMINPNMATMLTFITTDVAISPEMLNLALKKEIKQTINQINVDGDTSTNDMASIMANGLAGNTPITQTGADFDLFCQVLNHVCIWACRQIAFDGEGATKLLECTVTNARTEDVALAVSKSIISSDLFKSAMFGEDANWGRVLCAIGYTEGDFSIDGVSLKLKSEKGEVLVCQNAMYHPFSEEKAAEVLSAPHIEILVDMNDGTANAQAWGCDLTYEYVKINGDYRS